MVDPHHKAVQLIMGGEPEWHRFENEAQEERRAFRQSQREELEQEQTGGAHEEQQASRERVYREEAARAERRQRPRE